MWLHCEICITGLMLWWYNCIMCRIPSAFETIRGEAFAKHTHEPIKSISSEFILHFTHQIIRFISILNTCFVCISNMWLDGTHSSAHIYSNNGKRILDFMPGYSLKSFYRILIQPVFEALKFRLIHFCMRFVSQAIYNAMAWNTIRNGWSGFIDRKSAHN